MHQILLIVQVLVAVGLIALVLLQQGKGADAGASFGGGSSGSLFGSRGPSSFLAKLTAGFAVAFFVNSLALAFISGQSIERRSVMERFQESPVEDLKDVPAPGQFSSETGNVGDPSEPSDVPSVPSGNQ